MVRRAVRSLLRGEADLGDTSTIEDTSVLETLRDELAEALKPSEEGA